MENEIKNPLQEKINTLFDEYDMGFFTELELYCQIRSLMDEEIAEYLEENKEMPY